MPTFYVCVRVILYIWEFPKIRGTFLGVPIIRILVYWGLYWGPLIFGKLPYESEHYVGHLKMSYRACLAVHLAVQFRLSGWCRGAGLMRAGVYGAERGSPTSGWFFILFAFCERFFVAETKAMIFSTKMYGMPKNQYDIPSLRSARLSFFTPCIPGYILSFHIMLNFFPSSFSITVACRICCMFLISIQ